MDGEISTPANEGSAMRDCFLADVIDGLQQSQKLIPSRWLYDERGSILFDRITRLPEYYPTRTEAQILKDNVDRIANKIDPGSVLVEYGSGASEKTRILLDNIPALSGYIPIDISNEYLEQSAIALRREYPNLAVLPHVGDFLSPQILPNLPGRRVGFFPGSTIGNLSDVEILDFLTRARNDLGDDAHFVLGFDLRKSANVLIPAYNDAEGVTALFNLNILERANRELNANFNIKDFRHEARWNHQQSMIEMHLVSEADQTVEIDGRLFEFGLGETIRTEISRKFSKSELANLSERAGWSVDDFFLDRDDYFAVAVLS